MAGEWVRVRRHRHFITLIQLASVSVASVSILRGDPVAEGGGGGSGRPCRSQSEMEGADCLRNGWLRAAQPDLIGSKPTHDFQWKDPSVYNISGRQ
jgi:hypothetical protein